jgi:glutamate 5-kinase
MRIVIKVGTNVLRAGGNRIHRPRLIDLARQIAGLRHDGHEPILVSSGAVFSGRELLGVTPPAQAKEIPYKQMLAAVGQGRLMALYQQIFEMYDLIVAQALLTRDDIAHRTRYLNARNTLQLLLHYKVVPIINENDVVAVDEIKFGENDYLSGLVANLIDADLLIILTDQEGLLTADPRRHSTSALIRVVNAIDDDIRKLAGGSGEVGSGGMSSKIQAAELALRSGASVVIASGEQPDVILRVVAGEAVGTRFPAQISHRESRKRWILTEAAQGSITIDDGAAQALTVGGKSLLVVGVVGVAGEFSRGEPVVVLNSQGKEVGRGLANYSAANLRAIFGKQSHQIADILGYDYGPTAIHRDDLAVG